MSDLYFTLRSIGLDQYAQAFHEEGFETWHQLADVTEPDLESLGVKLGHRRRLQRAIQESRRDSGQQPLKRFNSGETDRADSHRSVNSSSGPASEHFADAHSTSQPPRAITTKRKYRRHPKPDDNAPERSPSAYVLFSNRVRERLKGQELSFTDIAKLVGEQWQDPDPEERAACEKQAQELKEDYYAKLGEYKKTQEYADYQVYLTEFKAKHGDQNSQDSKKVRVAVEQSFSTRSNSQEHQSGGTSPSRDGMSGEAYTPISQHGVNDTCGHADGGGPHNSSGWKSDSYSPGFSRHMTSTAMYSSQVDTIMGYGRGIRNWELPSPASRADRGPYTECASPEGDYPDRTFTMKAPPPPPREKGENRQRGSFGDFQGSGAVLPTRDGRSSSPAEQRHRTLPTPVGFGRDLPIPDALAASKPQHQQHKQQPQQLPPMVTLRQPRFPGAHSDYSLPPLTSTADGLQN